MKFLKPVYMLCGLAQTHQEGMAISWMHKLYPAPALSELDWSILLDAAPWEYILTETIFHSHGNYGCTEMERFGKPGIQPTTLVYIGKEMHEH